MRRGQRLLPRTMRDDGRPTEIGSRKPLPNGRDNGTQRYRFGTPEEMSSADDVPYMVNCQTHHMTVSVESYESLIAVVNGWTMCQEVCIGEVAQMKRDEREANQYRR